LVDWRHEPFSERLEDNERTTFCLGTAETEHLSAARPTDRFLKQILVSIERGGWLM